MSGIGTVVLHADREVHPARAVAPPIYQTATFWAEDGEQFARAAVSRRGQDFYTRYGNPNHAQVCAVVAELEHTEAALATASGMAALTAAVLALVSAGDHVIGQKSTYGGTASVLLNLLPRLGVSTSVVDQADPEAFGKAPRAQTRLILVESPAARCRLRRALRLGGPLGYQLPGEVQQLQVAGGQVRPTWPSAGRRRSTRHPSAVARAAAGQGRRSPGAVRGGRSPR
jgi:Cys/Met metabolism PLP-dependent enzyme